MPTEQNETSEKTIYKIIENYRSLESSLVSQLRLETPGHHPTTGTYRETVWKSLFEQMIPRKFCIEQGVFIIDSWGVISAEVDLAIFDEQYTPYIFNFGKIKFIPIEAVAVVIQCKSQTLDYETLKDWVESITKLKTSLASVARVMTGLVDNSLNEKSKSQTSTRPIRILCSTSTGEIAENKAKLFDISLSIDENDTFRKTMPDEGESYNKWYSKLNHFKIERYDNQAEQYGLARIGNIKNNEELWAEIDEIEKNEEKIWANKVFTNLKVSGRDEQENVILSLIFQINQMLMLINNPMWFPHEAYAKLFNDYSKNIPDKCVSQL